MVSDQEEIRLEARAKAVATTVQLVKVTVFSVAYLTSWPDPALQLLHYSQLPSSASATLASLLFPRPLEHVPTQGLPPIVLLL